MSSRCSTLHKHDLVSFYFDIATIEYNGLRGYHSLEAAAMADVTLLSEGRHPPGNIYSLMKSELRLYSSYLSSGIDMN